MKTKKGRIMANIIKILSFVLILMANNASISAQTLKMQRIDVDPSRANIITAGYQFAFDIYLEGVENTNNVSFVIEYNNAENIRFSQAKIGDFGDKGRLIVVPPSNINLGSTHRYSFGVLSGLSLQESGFADILVMRVEFVALQTLPDLATITFRLLNATATALIDSIGQNVSLATENIDITAHGYVNVFPGDANNDGEVNATDLAVVGLYFGTGSLTPNNKSFKRKSPSTAWYGQRALKWDIAPATYADCDGDGDVTISDGQVVFLNFDKTSGIDKSNSQIQNDKKSKQYSENHLKVPVYINNDKSLLSAALSLACDDFHRIVGLEPVEHFFSSCEELIISTENSTEAVIGTFDKEIVKIAQGHAFNIVLEKVNPNYQSSPNLIINKAKGMSLNGESYDLNLNVVSSVDDKLNNQTNVFTSNGYLVAHSQVAINSIKLYNLYGQIVNHYEGNSHHEFISQDKIGQGLYFCIVETPLGSFSSKLLVE